MESYGFEIEFCTHDSSLLSYTHVEVAKILLTGDEIVDGDVIPLKLETDSNNVLELVTPPIIFETNVQAKAFRTALAQFLKKSVETPLLLGSWLEQYWGDAFVNVLKGFYKEATGIDAEWESTVVAYDIVKIKSELIMENIDDGINMAAALALRNKEDYDFEALINNTILVASMKDYPTGFSTQMSHPMTSRDYSRYVLEKKYNKALERMGAITSCDIRKDVKFADLTWEKAERWLNSWCWLNIMGMGVDALFDNKDQSAIKSFETQITSLEHNKHVEQEGFKEVVKKVRRNLKNVEGYCKKNKPALDSEELLLSVIVIQKIITGTLGSLSEEQQLKLQVDANNLNTTSVMNESRKVREGTLVRWEDYHSSLKDLWSLWFKGWLIDVVSEYDERVRKNLGKRLKAFEDGKIWYSIIKPHWRLAIEAEEIYGGNLQCEFTGLRRRQLVELANKLGAISKQVSDMLLLNNSGLVPLRERQTGTVHEFLHYDEVLAWEGRKDTLLRPVPAIDDTHLGIRFLVEHRNN